MLSPSFITFANTTAWETAVIEAWAAEPDCSPSQMCEACGIGAAIVEMDMDNGHTNIRHIMTGPGDLPAPVNYIESTFESKC